MLESATLLPEPLTKLHYHIKMKCQVSVSCNRLTPKLTLTILNNSKILAQVLFDQDLTRVVNLTLDNKDCEHSLEFRLDGKTIEDTTVVDGVIVDDLSVIINSITIDDIDMTASVFELARYSHNFNGTQESVVTDFYGTMGCNGTVHVLYTGPTDYWIMSQF